MSDCPCNSARDYDECCGPLIRGDRKASSPVELMRSRYSAFVRVEIDYLGSSHDPVTRHEFDPDQARAWASDADWRGFELVRSEGGGTDDTTGEVEFIAHYTLKGVDVDHHEISEFRRDGDTWYFRDGNEVPVTVRRDSPKVARNGPCPCGSGKKYKKCCMNK